MIAACIVPWNYAEYQCLYLDCQGRVWESTKDSKYNVDVSAWMLAIRLDGGTNLIRKHSHKPHPGGGVLRGGLKVRVRVFHDFFHTLRDGSF
jgi:hypothetical protein